MESEGDQEQTGIVIMALGTEYGSMNVAAIADLDRRLGEEFDDSSIAVLIDLTETLYFGCELLNVLLRWRARVEQSHCRFALCALKRFPQETLALTLLDSLWEVFPTRREALEEMLRPLDNTESLHSFKSTSDLWRNTR